MHCNEGVSLLVIEIDFRPVKGNPPILSRLCSFALSSGVKTAVTAAIRPSKWNERRKVDGVELIGGLWKEPGALNECDK